MDGAFTLLLVVGAICLAVIVWAGRKRFPLRIGAGNLSGSGAAEAIINEKLATAVEAKAGQSLIVNLGTPQGVARVSLTVKEIVRDEGRGAWNDAENLFVPLATIQTALGETGRINTITVANIGGPK